MSERVQVGWFNLREARTFRTSFECAAWFRDVRVEAGRYPVYAYTTLMSSREFRFGHSLYADATGTVTGASFMALYAGSQIPGTRDRGADEIGTEAKASVSFSDFCLDRHVASGELELLPGLFQTTTHTREDGATSTHYWWVPATDADAVARFAELRTRVEQK
jgi:hypothetical protein